VTTIAIDRRTEDVRTMTPATQQAVAVELAGRSCARSRDGRWWASLKNLGRLALVALFASGCATTMRPDPAYEGPFAFALTQEQCDKLSKERRTYRATEKTASYVAGAGALVSVIALGVVDAKAVPAVASGVSLLAGGTLAFSGSQVESLDSELRDGGCGR
jgi:hypothetical protein